MAVASFKSYLLQKKRTFYDTSVTVFIGGDTRPSTEPLLDLVTLGIESQGGKSLNFHLATTPQLQYYGNCCIIKCILIMSSLSNKSQIHNKSEKVIG